MATKTTQSLPGPIKLLQDAWLIYKLRLRTIIILLVLSLAISWALTSVFIFVGVIGVIIGLVSKSPILIGVLIILAIIFFFVSIFVQTLMNIALIASIVYYREDRSLKELIQASFKKVLPYFWVSVLSALIVFCGYIFFVIPGIIFAIWFAPAVFVLIGEGTGGMNALLKSREYVRGYFWAVFLRYLFLVFLFIVVEIVFASAGFAFAFLKLPSISSLIFIPFGFVIGPIAIIYTFLIYDNLKAIKGNFVFNPSTKLKTFFYILTVLPITLIIVFAIFVGPTLLNLANVYKNLATSNKMGTISKPVDCMSDDLTAEGAAAMNPGLSCFEKNAETCIPTKVQVKQALDFNVNGLTTTSKITTNYEIQPLDQSKCVLNANLVSQYFILPRNVTNAKSEKISQETSNLVQQYLGSTGSCVFINSDLANILNRNGTSVFSPIDVQKGGCTGKYFDMIKSAEGFVIPTQAPQKIPTNSY